jgi:hypothetical protein
MDDVFLRIWGDLLGRIDGPMSFRLIVQPLVASVLAIRAGLNDARTQRAPYFWTILLNPGKRPDLVRNGWKDVAKLFTVAMALDVIYQFIAIRWVYPGEVVIVAIVLALVPYVLLRSLANRLARAGKGTVGREGARRSPTV